MKKSEFGRKMTGGWLLTRAQRKLLSEVYNMQLPAEVFVDSRDWSAWRRPRAEEARRDPGLRKINLSIPAAVLRAAAIKWRGW